MSQVLQKKSDFSKLLPYFSSYKLEIFFAILALISTALLILFFGRAIKYFIDYGFVEQSRTFINLSIAIFIFSVFVMAVAGYYRASLINSVCEKVIANLRKNVYSHIIRVSAEFFEIKKTGDVVSRLTTDTVLLYNIFTNNFSFFLRNLILFFGGILFLFLTSVKLTAISIALIALAISPIFFMGKLVKKLSNKSQEAVSNVGSHIEETLNGIKVVQAFLCEEKEAKNFANYVFEALKYSLKKIKIRSLLIALVITFAFGGIALVLWIGSNDVINQKMTSGDLSSFIFYSIISATSLVGISQFAGQMQTAISALARVFELLETESPVREIAAVKDLEMQEKNKIIIKDVSFFYPSRKDKMILQNFNLEINQGEKIALCGVSGSGKSTILQLLLRFYDVNLGEILINENNIKELSLKYLRQNFAYIAQDSFIFSGTVFQNIAYADNKITKKQVQKIIDDNEAFHFINNLKDGLDSFVGEKGIKLSGGERQRIAIARAIVKDAPIMLLDEATSALDNENEDLIARTIKNVAKDKTVISVAHKLSSVLNSNRIIFIKDGRVVEDGSHKELMGLKGFYAKMYEAESVGVV